MSETGSATVDELSIGAMANGGDKKKFEDKQFPLHAKLAAIRPATQANAAEYNAIYFAGGHAACIDFPTAVGLQKLAADIYESGGSVGAVCHGPAIFDGLKLSNGTSLLAGKRATGFSPAAEETMKVMDWMRQHSQIQLSQPTDNSEPRELQTCSRVSVLCSSSFCRPEDDARSGRGRRRPMARACIESDG